MIMHIWSGMTPWMETIFWCSENLTRRKIFTQKFWKINNCVLSFLTSGFLTHAGTLALPQPIIFRGIHCLFNQMPKYYTIFMFVHQPGEPFTLFIESFSAEFFTLFFFFLFCETFVFNLSIKLCLVKLLDGNFTFKFGPTGFWLAVCGLHSE